LFDGVLQDLLGAGGEGDLAEQHDVVARADDLLDLGAHAPQVHAEIGEHLGGDAFAERDEAEQDVLGPDVVVVEPLRLFLRDQDDALSPFGESIRHLKSSKKQIARRRFYARGSFSDYGTRRAVLQEARNNKETTATCLLP